MVKIGKRQRMKINNISSIGVYLDAETEDPMDNILLPNNEIEELDLKEGMELDVFIYMDSEDRPIATLKQSKCLVGTIAYLEAVATSTMGAFLDWGLPKDLLLPKDQQECQIEVGKSYLVGIYEDNKGRLTATMNIYKFLLPTFSYDVNDKVEGRVYRINPEIGVFVAVDDRYFGLIPNSEHYKKLKVGEMVEGRVMRVREDGKLDLSLRELLVQQMPKDGEKIIEAMKKGNFNLGDKSSPDAIKKQLGMSKKAFKRAVGALYKEKLIEKDGDTFKIKK